jgi:hypothetical protein
METYYEWSSGFDQWGQQVWYQVEKQRSRYIRSADGYLVQNTDANRSAVSSAERRTLSRAGN